MHQKAFYYQKTNAFILVRTSHLYILYVYSICLYKLFWLSYLLHWLIIVHFDTLSPYHLSCLLSWIVFDTDFAPSSLMCSFLILLFLLTSSFLLKNFIYPVCIWFCSFLSLPNFLIHTWVLVEILSCYIYFCFLM